MVALPNPPAKSLPLSDAITRPPNVFAKLRIAESPGSFPNISPTDLALIPRVLKAAANFVGFVPIELSMMIGSPSSAKPAFFLATCAVVEANFCTAPPFVTNQLQILNPTNSDSKICVS